MIKIGVFYQQIEAAVKEKGLTIEKAMDELREHGVTYVDVDSNYLLKEKPEVFSERLKEHGIHIISVHSDSCCDVNSEETLCESIEEMKKRMMLAKRAESKFFMIVPDKAQSFCEEQSEKFALGVRRMLKELAAYGKEIGMQATIENYSVRDFPYTSFDSIDWILRNIPDISYTYDSGNYLLAGFNELVGAKTFFDKTVYAHLKEVKPVEYETPLLKDGVYYYKVPFGEGIVNNFGVVDYYLENGYDGVFTVEMYNTDNTYAKTLLSVDRLQERILQQKPVKKGK